MSELPGRVTDSQPPLLSETSETGAIVFHIAERHAGHRPESVGGDAQAHDDHDVARRSVRPDDADVCQSRMNWWSHGVSISQADSCSLSARECARSTSVAASMSRALDGDARNASRECRIMWQQIDDWT